MNNITAALAIPQLNSIETTIEKVNENYDYLKTKLGHLTQISFPEIKSEIRPVRDSAQMRIKSTEEFLTKLKLKLNEGGIPISFFGGKNNTNARLYENWKFLNTSKAKLPNTKKNLSEVFDLRLPIHFSKEHIEAISKVFLEIYKSL